MYVLYIYLYLMVFTYHLYPFIMVCTYHLSPFISIYVSFCQSHWLWQRRPPRPQAAAAKDLDLAVSLDPADKKARNLTVSGALEIEMAM